MLTDTLMQSAIAVASATGVEDAAQDAVFDRINAEWEHAEREAYDATVGDRWDGQ